MTCTYCGSRYGHEDTRCHRCGRKPGDTLSDVYPPPMSNGNLAPQLQPVIAEPLARQADLARAVQVPLFRERSTSKVIPIETYAPARPRPAAPKAAKPAVRRAGRVSENQEKLDLLPPAPAAPKKLSTTVEAVIYCDAPVAHPLHRAIAAALDWAMVAIGIGIFFLAFRLLGGQIFLSKANLPIFGGIAALISLTYGLTWAIAATETPGMHWTKLRLITFDGFAPEARHRALRFLGSCLSHCTVIGILWSLADEESLTWQDHISRTFPTYPESDNQTFRRR
jgi:uncharacterized RDD family membrane protein YckC